MMMSRSSGSWTQSSMVFICGGRWKSGGELMMKGYGDGGKHFVTLKAMKDGGKLNIFSGVQVKFLYPEWQ